jgi:hypothetical protein
MMPVERTGSERKEPHSSHLYFRHYGNPTSAMSGAAAPVNAILAFLSI